MVERKGDSHAGLHQRLAWIRPGHRIGTEPAKSALGVLLDGRQRPKDVVPPIDVDHLSGNATTQRAHQE